jgi:hypothetical protein
MKLSISLFLFAGVLLSANNNNFVLGQTDANGNPCGAEDTNCSGEYSVPDAPSVCKGTEKVTDSCKVPCTINGISYVCTNGSFVAGNVGTAFTDPPAASPTGCDGTAKDCSGEAVIVFSKDSEESDVADIDVSDAGDSNELNDSAGTTTIVSSIIGFTAIVGVVALL